MTQTRGLADVYVVFSVPSGSPEWLGTHWHVGLRGVHSWRPAHTRQRRREATRFGALTSGHVLLYGADAALLFSGGITASRGHVGENPGRSAIVTLLSGQRPERGRTPTFGCLLPDHDRIAMSTSTTTLDDTVAMPPATARREYQGKTRAEQIFHEQHLTICQQTDRSFAALMIIQWLAGIAAALWISPRTWAGAESWIHLHVWLAILFGGVITWYPVTLAWLRPGRPSTRYVIAIGQMLTSVLLIHLSGGRIETHFHVFGSLAFLAFYRDWRVLVPATVVIATDHFLRGIYWPESVYGTFFASEWRWLEHAGWVLFEDIVLIAASQRSVREMWGIAERTADLEIGRSRLAEAQQFAHVGSWEWDAVAGHVKWSGEQRRMLGLNRGDRPESFSTYLRFVHPDDRERIIELARRVRTSSGRVRLRIPHRARRRGAARRPCQG